MFGGPPTFDQTLHVGRPNIGSREQFMCRMNDLLDRAWLSNNGPYVREFESRIAELTGAKNCIAMCNGTIALEIAVRALGMTGEVIVPSFTFVATAHCLQWQEVTPVFCDINASTHNLDPDRVEAAIGPQTTGIIGVHLWGRPCDTTALADIANRYGLKLLFDASHALGVTRKGVRVGSFGDAEVLSFHATKFINCFEGGAIVTNDDNLARKIRLMKNFGFAGLDNVIYLGTNGKMSEPSAAMGLTSLESMEEFIAVNKANYQYYQKGLERIPGCQMLTYDLSEENNFQYVVVEIDENGFGLSRDELVRILHAENVRARRYFYPGVHNMEPYKTLFPDVGKGLENTIQVAGRVICLPTGNGVDREAIRKICHLLEFVSNHSQAIREASVSQ